MAQRCPVGLKFQLSCCDCSPHQRRFLSTFPHVQELWLFWRKVQRLYEAGLLAQPSADGLGFFSGSWAGRGRTYRMLVEPLDIANWYFRDKHVHFGHYIDGIVNELQDDNRKRPGRYILLQQREHRAFGSAASSLDKARAAQGALKKPSLARAARGGDGC